jgi:hypothetical protein
MRNDIMKNLALTCVVAFGLLGVLPAPYAASGVPAPAAASEAHAPVLVELFTSEGCSDCPPADALLAALDREQPVKGAQAIVLSEHVTYWDHLGWHDPYSSDLFTQRQQDYGERFGLPSVYTPEMVVNGSAEFVGSDATEAQRAIEKASHADPVTLQISELAATPAGVRFHLRSGRITKDSNVIAVVALDSASSSVRAGENSGRVLHHVAVARNVRRVAELEQGKPLDQTFALPLNSGGVHDLRLVVFVQEKISGKIDGAAMARFSAITP